MTRINYNQQISHLVIFLFIQIPLLYKLVLFDKAFGFFYVGFVLLLPYRLNYVVAMVIAFLAGLLVDVFSSTPGIHSSASVLVVFVKDLWHDIIKGEPDEDVHLDFNELGLMGSIRYFLPLIFVHHLMIFIIENNGLQSFGHLVSKIFYSTLFSFFLVLGITVILTPVKRKR